jgi:transposase-like protein
MAQRVEHHPLDAAFAELLTNGLERINREIKRRTRVASIFPNPASCLRLVSALLAECDEDWMTGKIYLNLKD